MPRAATTTPGVLKVITPTRLPLVTPASRSAAADFFDASSSSAYVDAVSANTNASLWGNLCAVLSNIAVRSIVPALSCGNSHRAGRSGRVSSLTLHKQLNHDSIVCGRVPGTHRTEEEARWRTGR